MDIYIYIHIYIHVYIYILIHIMGYTTNSMFYRRPQTWLGNPPSGAMSGSSYELIFTTIYRWFNCGLW